MADDINFIADKGKETNKKEALKKRAFASQVRFHVPEKEVDSVEPVAQPSVMFTLIKFLRKFFKPRSRSARPDSQNSQMVKRLDITGKKLKPSSAVGSEIKALASPESKSEASGALGLDKSVPPSSLAKAPAPASQEDFDYIDVNLIPWLDPAIRRRHLMRVALVLASLLVVIIWGITLKIKNEAREAKITGLQRAADNLEAQLESIDATLLSEGSGLAIRQRKLAALMSTVPHWSQFISWLESITDPEIYFSSLTVDHTGEINLEAQAPDFATAARQWLAFEQATSWVEMVDISGVSSSQSTESGPSKSGVKFSVSLELSLDQLREPIELDNF